MRIFGPVSPRNIPLDRNPTTIHQGTGQGITAGANVVLGTYVVPAGRRARIESSTTWFLVTTALAAGQTLLMAVQVTVPAPTSPVVTIESGPAAVGPESQDGLGGVVELTAGQTIEARATIGAGAGVATVRAGFHGVEYDV